MTTTEILAILINIRTWVAKIEDLRGKSGPLTMFLLYIEQELDHLIECLEKEVERDGR